MVLNAICVLAGTLTGIIYLSQEDATSTTTITGTITGLTPVGNHGFHVHQYGDLSDGACVNTLAHYNPAGVNHGGPDAAVRHRGDLGNIVTAADGSTAISIVDSQVVLYGEYSVLGRAIVVHQDEDDLGLGGAATSLTTGNAGARLGCCVIGITDQTGPTTVAAATTTSTASSTESSSASSTDSSSASSTDSSTASSTDSSSASSTDSSTASSTDSSTASSTDSSTASSTDSSTASSTDSSSASSTDSSTASSTVSSTDSSTASSTDSSTATIAA